MLIFKGTVVLAIVGYVVGTYSKSVKDDIYDAAPGAIKVDDEYYLVTENNDLKKGNFRIYKGDEINKWTSLGYVFKKKNFPHWANGLELHSPKIHKVQNKFLIYFFAENKIKSLHYVGVAVASHPKGPYTSTQRPLLSHKKQYLDPSIIQTTDDLYLIWIESLNVRARPLNPDGLTFKNDTITTIFKSSTPWEKNIIHAPWHFQRKEYHYIFYSARGHLCDDELSTSVARSTNILGPYRTLTYPIINENQNFKSAGYVSVVKGANNNLEDLIFFSAYEHEQKCNYRIFVAPIKWNEGDWPIIEVF